MKTLAWISQDRVIKITPVTIQGNLNISDSHQGLAMENVQNIKKMKIGFDYGYFVVLGNYHCKVIVINVLLLIFILIITD